MTLALSPAEIARRKAVRAAGRRAGRNRQAPAPPEKVIAWDAAAPENMLRALTRAFAAAWLDYRSATQDVRLSYGRRPTIEARGAR